MFLIVFLFLLFPPQLIAQSVTPTPDAKTEAIRELAEKKVQDMLGITSSSLSSTIPKSVVGTITKIDNNNIISSFKNENKELETNSETVIINEKKLKAKFTDLKEGQTILAMGYYDQFSNFAAKRIIITNSEDIKNKNEIVFGTITDISQSSDVLVLVPIKNKNTQYQIKISSKTKITNKDGDSLTLSKLKKGQKVTAVIQPNIKISNTFDVFQIVTVNNPTASN